MAHVLHNAAEEPPEPPITPERIARARSVVLGFVQLEPAAVSESVGLAWRMQGVGSALSTIVLSQGGRRFTSVEMAPKPAAAVRRPGRGNTSHRFDPLPPARTQKIFIAEAAPGQLVRLDLHQEVPGAITDCNVVVPSDRAIDGLLGQEPCLWDNPLAAAADNRGSTLQSAYPFSSGLCGKGDAIAYFGLLQELSGKLLTATQRG